MATSTQGNAAASNVLTISISAPPAAPSISPSGTVPFCTGLTVDLTASTTAPTYKWFLNGTLIPGASAQIYSASAAGSYRVLSINASGCESDTSTAVTVVANQDPVTTCPSNITVNNSPGTCGQTVTYSCTITGTPAPTITYAFTGATTGSGSGTGSGSVFGRGVTTVTITASNTCSTTSCSFTVTVSDNQAPTASNVTNNYSCLSSVPAADPAVITDEADYCGTPTVTFQSGLTTNNGGTGCAASPLIITRYYRVEDGSGNFILATHTISVVDNIAPAITSCPAPVTVSCTSSVPAPNTGLVTDTENCGGAVTVTHIGDVISAQTCASRYTISRTYRATDACGNSEVCTQVITVNDQTAPVLTCPANINATTPIGSCTAVVNFTPTATDACGNTSTCSFTVTVTDGQLPVISQQPQTRYVCESTNASFSVTATNAVSYQWQQWTGSTWANISGATTATLNVNTVGVNQNTTTYRVQVIGLCTTVNSAPATLYVNPLPTVNIIPSLSPILQPGQTLSISSSVSPGGGTYRWFRNGTQLTSPLQQGPVLNGITIDGAGTYRLTYTDPNGCSISSQDLAIQAEPSVKLWAYPNPTTGKVTLRYYNVPDGKAFIVVYGANGAQLIRRSIVTTNPYGSIDMELTPPGNAPARAFAFPTESYIVILYSQSGVQLGSTKIMVHRD